MCPKMPSALRHGRTDRIGRTCLRTLDALSADCLDECLAQSTYINADEVNNKRDKNEQKHKQRRAIGEKHLAKSASQETRIGRYVHVNKKVVKRIQMLAKSLRDMDIEVASEDSAMSIAE